MRLSNSPYRTGVSIMHYSDVSYNKLPRLLLACSLAAITFFSTGCSDKQVTSTQAEQTITQTATENTENLTTYLVAVEAAYAPYAFRDEMGEVVGFDEDILLAIAKNQGFNVKFLSQSWTGIFDTLDNNTRDIVASGVIVTDERKQTMNFSDPIVETSRIVVVRNDSGIKSTDDLQGKTIATQNETTMHKELKERYDNSDNIIGEKTQYLAFKNMLGQKVDAVYGDSGVLEYYINNSQKDHPDIKINTLKFADQDVSHVAFALSKNRNDDLLAKINKGLANIKADGTYNTIYQKWFGTTKN